MDDLTALAVKNSLSGNWDEAIKLNEQIIKSDSVNIAALCRLGKAYLELGKVKESLSSYQKVLKLDPINQIAIKNLEKLKSLPTQRIKTNHTSETNHLLSFIEEPGRTRTISLVKLAPPQLLTQLDPGQQVYLTPRQHSISITLYDGTTIGKLPDDVAARLIPMIKSGNSYTALIRSISPTSAKILIREEKRSKRFQNIPTFPTSERSGYIASIPADLITDDELADEPPEGTEAKED